MNSDKKITHAGIIPLIGGEILASEEAYGGVKPEYLMTYSGFKENEKHLLNRYKNQGYDIPYYVLDSDDAPKEFQTVDIVSSVCPCSGLSNYHSKYGEENQNNQWMEKSTKFVLETVRPKVLWGENAPALATNVGKFMKDKLESIGDAAGYNMSLYITKTLLHGSPQIRRRSFFFFWRRDFFDNRIPVLNYYNKEPTSIRDLIVNARGNSQREVISKKIPSKDDHYYRYFLEEVKNGMSHKDFSQSLVDEKFETPFFNVEFEMIRNMKITFEDIGKWMSSKGLEREAEKCARKHLKITAGKNVMWRGTIVPVHHIGAFVVHMPYFVTHPVEDRYVNYREAMTIMGLPDDFELLDQENSINHICQNVPYFTAKDMAIEVKSALEGRREMVQSSFMIQSNLNRSIIETKTNFDMSNFFE